MLFFKLLQFIFRNYHFEYIIYSHISIILIFLLLLCFMLINVLDAFICWHFGNFLFNLFFKLACVCCCRAFFQEILLLYLRKNLWYMLLLCRISIHFFNHFYIQWIFMLFILFSCRVLGNFLYYLLSLLCSMFICWWLLLVHLRCINIFCCCCKLAFTNSGLANLPFFMIILTVLAFFFYICLVAGK